jgi:hypothetical protein
MPLLMEHAHNLRFSFADTKKGCIWMNKEPSKTKKFIAFSAGDRVTTNSLNFDRYLPNDGVSDLR